MVLLDLNSLVNPGWFPLLLVLIIGVAIAGLFFSMRSHLRKIDVPVDPHHPEAGPFERPQGR